MDWWIEKSRQHNLKAATAREIAVPDTTNVVFNGFGGKHFAGDDG